jgi:hypothetical protein
MAEFESAEELVRAHERLRSLGYTRLRTWTPYPVKSLIKEWPQSIVPWWMLGGALLGGCFGYILQWWCNARDFPIDVGGRPLNSIPAFIPIAFESAVLAASLTGFFALMGVTGLPRLFHPVFTVDGFERASVDRFWLGVDGADPLYDDGVGEELVRAGAVRAHRLGGPP